MRIGPQNCFKFTPIPLKNDQRRFYPNGLKYKYIFEQRGDEKEKRYKLKDIVWLSTKISNENSSKMNEGKCRELEFWS